MLKKLSSLKKENKELKEYIKEMNNYLKEIIVEKNSEMRKSGLRSFNISHKSLRSKVLSSMYPILD